MRINNKDYISLTDLARYKNESNSGDVIIKWMSNKSSFDFYCLWEELFKIRFIKDETIAKTEKEFKIYREREMKELQSDFDLMMKSLPNINRK